MTGKAKDIPVGSVFGMLTVLERAGSNHRGDSLWRVRCECGNEIDTQGSFLRGGRAQSCGCKKGFQQKYSKDPVEVSKRFWEQVVEDGKCWVWTGQVISKKYGYGAFYNGTRNVPAHVWAYEEMIHEVPKGLELDHLCENSACVNPYHLDPVTHAENVRRKDPKVRAQHTVDRTT